MIDFWISLKREDVLGQLGWKRLAGLRVLQVPVLDGILQKWNMFLRSQEDLEGLPAAEAPGGQGRYARGFEVIPGGLQAVLAAGDLPYPGYGRVVTLNEECWSRGG